MAPPAPEPEAEVEMAAVPPRDSQPAAAGTGSGTGPGTGPGAGGGTGGGTGGGVGPGPGPGPGPGTGGGEDGRARPPLLPRPAIGPGTGGGKGGRARPPQLRHLATLPGGPPDALKGRTVRVTFFVGPGGAVQDLEVVPPIEDRGYARKVRDRLESYRFRPALD